MITETLGVPGAWLFTSVQSQPRVDNYPERGARLARREERAYREYVRDEQRSQPRGPQRGSRVGVEEGCPAWRIVKSWLGQDTSAATAPSSPHRRPPRRRRPSRS